LREKEDVLQDTKRDLSALEKELQVLILTHNSRESTPTGILEYLAALQLAAFMLKIS